jgi:hypothetical protein
MKSLFITEQRLDENGVVILRIRNVFVLGIFHGWLGALFFYTVAGRDPFLEVFGKLLDKL